MTKRAIDTLVEQPSIEVPYRVMCVISTKQLHFAGNQSCISDEGDFVELEQTREAIEWLANQYGGNIVWAQHGKSQTRKAAKQR